MIPISAPAPDCNGLKDVLLRRTTGSRVHFLEHAIDTPVLAEISSEYLGREWVPMEADKRKHWDATINVHRALGFDAFKIIGIDFIDHDYVREKKRARSGTDSVTWSGMIESWDDFERYPWPDYRDADYESIEYVHEHLPDGMGIFISAHMGPFALASTFFLGIENLAYLSMDDPDLVRAVFDRLSTTKLAFMEQVIGLPKVLGVWAHDDMGHKTATMVSPEFLRTFNLPHHKKMAALAHRHGKLFALHSCGNMYALMDDLIHDVQIDAKHSYEDIILPVSAMKQQYGDQVSVIGGVDVDVLCRAEMSELEAHVRGVLEVCTAGGGYALGSGNSIAKYVPVERFLAMLKVGAEFTMG